MWISRYSAFGGAILYSTVTVRRLYPNSLLSHAVNVSAHRSIAKNLMKLLLAEKIIAQKFVRSPLFYTFAE